MHDHQNPGDKMPCKGMLPGCVTDLGCIFLVSLPAPDLTLVGVTAWSSVSYHTASQGLHGRTIKPALGPPIRTGAGRRVAGALLLSAHLSVVRYASA